MPLPYNCKREDNGKIRRSFLTVVQAEPPCGGRSLVRAGGPPNGGVAPQPQAQRACGKVTGGHLYKKRRDIGKNDTKRSNFVAEQIFLLTSELWRDVTKKFSGDL